MLGLSGYSDPVDAGELRKECPNVRKIFRSNELQSGAFGAYPLENLEIYCEPDEKCDENLCPVRVRGVEEIVS